MDVRESSVLQRTVRLAGRLAFCIAFVGLFFWVNSTVSYAQQVGVDVTPNPSQENQPLVMTVTITNDTGSMMATVPLSVTYDTTYISYNTVAGTTPPADSSGDVGQIDWTDVTGGAGLADTASTQVTINLTARAATTGQSGCPSAAAADNTCIIANSGGSQFQQGVLVAASVGKYSIGDTVWHDINNDGDQDSNEPGVNGVLVYLYEDTGANAGVWDAGDTVVMSTTTLISNTISGSYIFTNVVGSKNYIVRIDPSNFDPGGPLEGFVFSDSSTDVATGGQFVNNLSTNVDNVDFGLYCRFDLALDKKLEASQPANIAPGDDVTYTITIYNQGIITASNIMVVDYIPAGFSLSTSDANGWTPPGGTGTVTATVAGTLAPSGTVGSSTTINIRLTSGSTTGVITNTAEVASADSSVKDSNGANLPDADSTPDNTDKTSAGEDGNLVDDAVDEDGKNGGDEDDHDIAPITVTDADVYDMALIKELAAGQSASVEPTDLVTYVITVKNQGTVNSGVITVEDQIPAGMSYVRASGRAFSTDAGGGINVVGAAGQVFTTVITDMLPSSISVITLTLSISDVSLAPFRNWAEITVDGGDDVDSDPDDNNGNDNVAGTGPAAGDPVVNHNDIDHNAPNDDRNTDEDDSDFEDVDVEINYDMALIKELAAGQSTSVQATDLVTYVVTIKNQGNVNSGVVEVLDTIPAGMSSTSASAKAYGIAAGGGIKITDLSAASITAVITDLVPSAIAQITLTVQVNDLAQAPFRNWAEITADGGDDADSDPGDNNGNDSGVGDGGNGGDPVVNHNDIDHNAPNNDRLVDEDDSDYEDVQAGGVFDLALVKVVDSGSVQVGDMVTFTMYVKNQGSVDASNVEICDWLPTGFVSASSANNSDPNWSFATSYPIYSIASLDAGETVSFTLAVEVSATAGTTAGDLTNQAGVRRAERDDDGPPQITTDEDGTFTGISPAPPVTDVVDQLLPSDVDTDLVPNDDDDHDIAVVTLAGPLTPMIEISKVLNTPEPLTRGREMSFTIIITNTGDITVTYLPLEDTYNRVFIAYQNAQPATVDNADDGIINWTDLVSGTAGLAPQDSITVTVNFLAAADTSAQPAGAPCTNSGETCNVARTVGPNGEPPTGTPPGGGPPVTIPPVEDADDVEILSPTAVTLAQRSVVETPNGVLLRWSTVNEVNIIGFYVWHSNGSNADLRTTTMITADNIGQPSGAQYSYLDQDASYNSGDSYILEIVYADGRTERTTIGAANGRTLFLPAIAK